MLEEALRVAVAARFQEMCSYAKKRLLVVPGVCAIDEALNYNLLGHAEAQAFATLRGFGVRVFAGLQAFDFATPQIKQKIIQCSGRRWFQCGDWEMAQEGCRDLLGCLDEHKIHHTTQKQIHLGNTVEERGTRSSSKSSDGKKTETKGVSFVSIPEYVTRVEPVYETGNEQLIWKAQDLQELDVGECWARDMGSRPYRMKYPLVEDSWAFPAMPELGIKPLSDEKVEELLCLVKQRPEYQVPVMVELPAKAPTPMRQNATKPSSNGSGRSAQRQQSRR